MRHPLAVENQIPKEKVGGGTESDKCRPSSTDYLWGEGGKA